MVRRSWSWRGVLDGSKGGGRLLLPLLFVFGAFPVPHVHGADRTLSGYFDTGKRTAWEDFDNDAVDDEYTYRNYNLKYDDTRREGLEYGAGTFQKFRDYKDSNALDNRASTYKGQAAYDFSRDKKEDLILGLDLKHKTKRFDNAPRNEYDENMVSPSFTKARRGLYRMTVEGGIDAFDYVHAGDKDEKTWFGRANGNRYFNGDKVNLSSSYKIAKMEKKRAFKKRVKQEWMGSGAFKFDSTKINKATFRANAGQRDTKEEDELDIDYDYRYWNVHGKTYHDIDEDTDMTLEYEHFGKNYLYYNRDNTGFSVQNQWKRVFRKNERERFWASVTLGHKEAEYRLIPGNDYDKNTVELKAVYWRKKTWTATLLADANAYDFKDSEKDKKRYTLSLEWDKDLKDGALELILAGKYSATDYKAKNDTERVSARVAFSYGF